MCYRRRTGWRAGGRSSFRGKPLRRLSALPSGAAPRRATLLQRRTGREQHDQATRIRAQSASRDPRTQLHRSSIRCPREMERRTNAVRQAKRHDRPTSGEGLRLRRGWPERPQVAVGGARRRARLQRRYRRRLPAGRQGSRRASGSPPTTRSPSSSPTRRWPSAQLPVRFGLRAATSSRSRKAGPRSPSRSTRSSRAGRACSWVAPCSRRWTTRWLPWTA